MTPKGAERLIRPCCHTWVDAAPLYRSHVRLPHARTCRYRTP